MNRRNFIFRTAVATATLVAAPAIAFTPTPAPPPVDPDEIMSPDEIRARLGPDRYVDTPVFRRGDNVYCVKTCKLKITLGAKTWEKYRRCWLPIVQTNVKAEIKHLGLTHIHTVRFNEVHILSHNEEPYVCVFVRGARVKVL